VVSVRIDAADVEGVTVPLTRSARITGRLTSEDGPLPRGTQVKVGALFDEAYQVNRPGPAPVAVASEDAPFELTDLFGPIRFYVSGLPPGWAVRAIRCMGRDIASQPVEIPPGTVQPLEVVVTGRGAIVSGSVSNQRGEPAPTGTAVILLPADLTGAWSPLVPLTVTKDGGFKLPAQRAGEYWIAAVDMAEMMAVVDARGGDLTAKFKKVAERITLADGEPRTIDLRLVKIPEDR
jgi:hypothetical protein